MEELNKYSKDELIKLKQNIDDKLKTIEVKNSKPSNKDTIPSLKGVLKKLLDNH